VFDFKEFFGAGNGVRTRDPRLGKPMLYQLSYARPNEFLFNFKALDNFLRCTILNIFRIFIDIY
jgi:hypothetical protein